MVRDALADATALFADGDELAEKVHRISGRECQFLPSLRQFNYRMLPIPREKFFLYLGRIEKSKGVFDLLRAFAMLKQDIWDYRLLYIGEGSAAAKLKKEIERLKVRGKVHLLGRAPVEEVINYLQRARATRHANPQRFNPARVWRSLADGHSDGRDKCRRFGDLSPGQQARICGSEEVDQGT